MRSNKEIMNDCNLYPDTIRNIHARDGNLGTTYDRINKAMKEAKKEIVEYVLQKAAENARLTKIKERDDGVFELGIKQISKQSILSLKEEIIKEIENGNNI